MFACSSSPLSSALPTQKCVNWVAARINLDSWFENVSEFSSKFSPNSTVLPKTLRRQFWTYFKPSFQNLTKHHPKIFYRFVYQDKDSLKIFDVNEHFFLITDIFQLVLTILCLQWTTSNNMFLSQNGSRVPLYLRNFDQKLRSREMKPWTESRDSKLRFQKKIRIFLETFISKFSLLSKFVAISWFTKQTTK